MPSFLEKAVNCYISYLTNLNYGITDQKYCILYDSWILLKNNITDRRIVDYYSSHLNCPIKIKLELSMDVKNLITWTINKSGATTNLFEWNNIDILNTNKNYTVTTNSVVGYNYFYLTLPQNLDFTIYDEMNNLLFDTKNTNENLNNGFILEGTIKTINNQTNLVYRKKNMFNTVNKVTFNIKLY